MKIFFYGGIAFLAVGLVCLYFSLDSAGIAYGWVFVLGCILFLTGAVLTVVTTPIGSNQRELGSERKASELSASRRQKAVALIVGSSFLTVFFLVYPGGLLRSYIANEPPTESETQLFEGLKYVYNTGDTLTFSISTGSCWWETDELPQTTIKKIKDKDDNSDVKTIWVGIAPLKTPEDCKDYSGASTTYYEGTFKPLILEEAGVYEVTADLDYSGGNTRQFTVIES